MLLPGPAHPNRAVTPEVLARRYGLDVAALRRWIDEGLPQGPDGRIDPFAASNWISWHRLGECPVLARAWRGYLLVFAGFLAGDQARRRVRWLRHHALHLPGEPRALTWWLPRPARTATQEVLAEQPLGDADRGHWRIEREAPGSLPTVEGSVSLELTPRPTGELPGIAEVVIELVADFSYQYRHHLTGERLAGAASSGSCLDCVRELVRRFTVMGRESRIVAGLIVHDAFSNPHYWVEVETPGGVWMPVDPSLPAIARMLGADWRAVARAYSGGCDARRVQLAGGAISEIPGGPTSGSLIGEALVDGANAWACIDWVCGDCSAEFERI